MTKTIRAATFLFILGLAVATAWASTVEDRATITLGTDPEPPACAVNPGGVTTIFWSIQHSTVPDHVFYRLLDPSHATVIESQDYPGSTGINISRQWTVPEGAVAGMYWVRVEYYSVGIGLEAAAEVGFLVCQPEPPQVCCIGLLCYMFTESVCEELGGVWYPDLDSCDTDPCVPPPPSAVCCLGEACSILLESECADYGGLWYPDQTSCEPNPCLPPPPTAVCCVGTECQLLTEIECADIGGIFLPDITSCEGTNPCEASPTDPLNWGTIKGLFQ
jgi:hypothetical protein